jgi:hypothetical protein
MTSWQFQLAACVERVNWLELTHAAKQLLLLADQAPSPFKLVAQRLTIP